MKSEPMQPHKLQNLINYDEVNNKRMLIQRIRVIHP
jgi:hypothetical protein